MANPRVFEVEEVNALIGKLTPLVKEFKEKKERMQVRHDELLVLDLMKTGEEFSYESSEGKEYLRRSAELESLILSFEEDIIQINQIGGFLKHIEKGEVDFFHVRDKKLVYLCWRLGENEVCYWHDMEGEFEDRIPL